MGATILFPQEPHWSVGSHGFWPIVDRIRASLTESDRLLVEPLFEPAEVFQFIDLGEDVSPEAFWCFARAAISEFERCSKSEEAAQLPHKYYPGIMDCWAELVRRLEADDRWIAAKSPSFDRFG